MVIINNTTPDICSVLWIRIIKSTEVICNGSRKKRGKAGDNGLLTQPIAAWSAEEV